MKKLFCLLWVLVHICLTFKNVIQALFMPVCWNIIVLKLGYMYLFYHHANITCLFSARINYPSWSFFQGMYIKSTYDGLHVITGTTENVSFLILKDCSLFCNVKTCYETSYFLSFIFFFFYIYHITLKI